MQRQTLLWWSLSNWLFFFWGGGSLWCVSQYCRNDLLLFPLHHDFKSQALDQGRTNLALPGHFPSEFSSNPNQTHLNQVIIVFKTTRRLRAGEFFSGLEQISAGKWPGRAKFAYHCSRLRPECARMRMCEFKFDMVAFVRVHGLRCSKASASYSVRCRATPHCRRSQISLITWRKALSAWALHG